MGKHEHDPLTGAYTSPPRPRKTAASPAFAVAGAGIAAAVGLTWLLSPGFSAPKAPAPVPVAPAAPAAPAASAMAPSLPMPAAAISARPKAAASMIRPLLAGVEGGSAAPAGLAAAAVSMAFAAPSVAWKWPVQLNASFARALSGGSGAPVAGAPPSIVRQTILSWNPNGVSGRRSLYHQVLSDGTERDRVESELTLPTLPVQQDPLVFDLANTGIKTSSRKAIYGITGTKDDDKLKWLNEVEEGMGILVFDADKDGASGRTGLELFGDQSDLNGDGKSDGFPDGFSTLRAFVDRASRDGVLPPDARARGLLDASALAALEKAYGLKMKVGGFNRVPVTLKTAGVKEISFSEAPAEPAREFDGRGNGLSLHPGAAFSRPDGSRGIYANVWLTAK
jgi:hypothetical protein